MERYKWLDFMSRNIVMQSPLYIKYLSKKLEIAPVGQEKCEVLTALAEEYLYRKEDAKTALQYYERARGERGDEFLQDFAYSAMVANYIEMGDKTKAQDVFFEQMEHHYKERLDSNYDASPQQT